MYAQHTADTGQVFPLEAVARAYRWSQGQPWLVNALAREGWLVIFDRRPDIPWDQRIGWKTVEQDGRTLHIVGC